MTLSTLFSVLFFPLGMHHKSKAYIYGRSEKKRLAAVHKSNQFIAAAMTTSKRTQNLSTLHCIVLVLVLVLYTALSFAQNANCSCACV